MSSDRRLRSTDLPLVTAVLTDLEAKLRRVSPKIVHQHIDVAACLRFIAGHGNAYIIDESYLVTYEVGTPWWSSPDLSILSESLVLRLAVSGDFNAIPAFLERKGREAGCKLAIAGTALAKSDRALASLYIRNGFTTETFTLVKEL